MSIYWQVSTRTQVVINCLMLLHQSAHKDILSQVLGSQVFYMTSWAITRSQHYVLQWQDHFWRNDYFDYSCRGLRLLPCHRLFRRSVHKGFGVDQVSVTIELIDLSGIIKPSRPICSLGALCFPHSGDLFLASLERGSGLTLSVGMGCSRA